MQKTFSMPAPTLQTHKATIEGNEYTFTEMTGAQRVTVDVESGIADQEKENTPLVWFDYQLLYIALSLEASTGASYKAIVPEIRKQRLETINQMFDAARIANNGAEEDGSPKGESA